jgi:hypothetical protein
VGLTGTLQIVPLWNYASGTGYTFTPYNPIGPTGASFTVTNSGTYLALYGLVANPNLTLARDFYTTFAGPPVDFTPTATSWIAVVVNGVDIDAIGAVPIGLSFTMNNQVGYPSEPIDLSYHTCSGFGQILLNLSAGDMVQLKMYLATLYPTTDEALYIASSNLQFPYLEGTTEHRNARGGTLTLIKIN